MANLIFKGAASAIVTPMNEDFSVNYEKFRDLLEFQIKEGISALVVCGTTGESATLTHEEHIDVIKFAVEVVAGRVPVIAGTGSNDTAFALELSLAAQKAGADALLMVTPYYNKTSQAGLIAHFTYVADRVDLPIILYNVPSRTGVNIKPETYAELAKHKNIVAAKEANGDISALAKTISLCGPDFAIYSGNDDQIIPFLSLGGKGVISVLSDVAPKATEEMCQKFFRGDIEGAAKMQIEYLDLINNLFADVNPIPVKEALNIMGFEVGPCRMPLVAPSDAVKEKLTASLKAVGLL